MELTGRAVSERLPLELPSSLRPMARVYCALANTVGTGWSVGEGFLLAQSRLMHPLVNFGFATQLTPYSARELADQVSSSTVSVYVDANNSVANALMRRNGFAEAFCLRCLTTPPIRSEPRLSEFADMEMTFCGEDDRGAAADFMLRQFFRHQDRGMQEIFWRALEVAVDLPIATVTSQGTVVAAGLITEVKAGEPVGIFNFCVDPRFQKRGLGSSFLQWLRHSRPGSEVAVQCSDSIANWYQKRGFTERTSMIAYRKIEAYPA